MNGKVPGTNKILGITPHFLPVLSSCSSTLFFLYFILELFVTSLPISCSHSHPTKLRLQIIWGWPKSSFKFFLNIFMKKPELTFGPFNISTKNQFCEGDHLSENLFLFSLVLCTDFCVYGVFIFYIISSLFKSLVLEISVAS